MFNTTDVFQHVVLSVLELYILSRFLLSVLSFIFRINVSVMQNGTVDVRNASQCELLGCTQGSRQLQ